MTDLIAELAEVVRLSDKATPGEWRGHPSDGVVILGANEGGFCIADCPKPAENVAAIVATLNFIRTHAAEIDAMARDAESWRALLRSVGAEQLVAASGHHHTA